MRGRNFQRPQANGPMKFADMSALIARSPDTGGLAQMPQSVRRRGLKRKRVKHSAHIALQGIIDHLVLLHLALAAESLGADFGRIVISVAGKVANGHARAGYTRLNTILNVAGVQ